MRMWISKSENRILRMQMRILPIITSTCTILSFNYLMIFIFNFLWFFLCLEFMQRHYFPLIVLLLNLEPRDGLLVISYVQDTWGGYQWSFMLFIFM